MNKKDYIIKRIKEKFNVFEGGLKALRENLNDFKTIKFILLEDYNFPYLYWRVYSKKVSFTNMLKDYFFGEEDCIHELTEFPIFYDVDKDRFVRVSYIIKENIEVI